MGKMATAWALALSVTASGARAGALIADDCEGASPVPPWSAIQRSTASNSVAYWPAAAHRGDGGLRAIDVNAASTAGRTEGTAYVNLANPSGAYFFRFWMRLSQTVTVNDDVVLAALVSNSVNPSSPDIFDLELNTPDSALYSSGADATTSYLQNKGDGGVFVSTGQWHLYEQELAGVGTDAGVRALWIDGVRMMMDQGIDFGGIVLVRAYAGCTWDATGLWTGTLDYDDLRTSLTRPASRVVLAVGADAGAVVGECLGVAVALQDSTGALATAPYDVVVNLAADGGGFFSDSRCATGTSALTVPQGSSGQTAWFSPTVPGTAVLNATHSDFLNDVASTLPVSTLAQDAGSSGGLDGGAKGTDAGPGASPARLEVGCGCDLGAPSLLLTGLLCAALGLPRTRRRRLQN